MEYLLKVMKILYVLSTDYPKPSGDGPVGTYKNEQWKFDDFDCRNEILNYLDNSLYDVFPKFKTAEGLWEALIKEYATKDAVAKNYAIEQFWKF